VWPTRSARVGYEDRVGQGSSFATLEVGDILHWSLKTQNKSPRSVCRPLHLMQGRVCGTHSSRLHPSIVSLSSSPHSYEFVPLHLFVLAFVDSKQEEVMHIRIRSERQRRRALLVLLEVETLHVAQCECIETCKMLRERREDIAELRCRPDNKERFKCRNPVRAAVLPPD